MQIGDYTFDPTSGDLARDAPGENGRVVRLPPQPARLLALLASRRGEVVSHEEIRRELWPDVQVDFERGLHFCVRQVRDALDDSADEPRYVETLPRRGYRLLAESSVTAASGGEETRARRRGLLLLAAGALVVVTLAGFVVLRSPGVAAAGAPRIAILPFRAPPSLPKAEEHTVIAEAILLSLDRRLGDSVELIGPTSTAAWRGDEASLRTLMAELAPQYVVNGRYLVEGERIRLLGELIRWPDGAHVWVEAFDPIPSAGEVAARVAAGVAAYVEPNAR
jgi:DNA-binding winged helix-turn-helix (wHTH) protein/TolB-like protein